MLWRRLVRFGPLVVVFAVLAPSGVMTTRASATVATPQEAGVAVTTVAAADEHSCALFRQGTVKCWGENLTGGLGLGNRYDHGDDPGEMGRQLGRVDLGTGRTATAISGGDSFTCALLDDGGVKCWGRNHEGQLGQGDDLNRGSGAGQLGDHLPPIDLGAGRTAAAITAAGSHACARLDDGTVKCWGIGPVLGLGIPSDRDNRGDDPGEMGDALPAVDLGAGHSVVEIATGIAHTCAILDDGSLKCWGRNYAGQLGVGDSLDRGMRAGDMGDMLPAVDLGTGRTAVHVAVGGATTCALLDDGSLKCWGDGQYGQLGRDAYHVGTEPHHMGDRLPVVELGPGRTARAITVGDEHVCAVLDDASLKCWGRNEYGQLGQGDTTSRRDIPAMAAVDLGTARHATAIAAGTDHTCAVLEEGDVKCWGRNARGGLGLGDRSSRGTAPGQMGDDLATVDLVVGRHVLQPDLSLKHAGGPWTGDDRYDDDSLPQRDAVRRERLGSVTFYLRVQNDGDHSERLNVLQLGGSDWHLRRRYFQGRSAKEVTAAVLTGQHLTPVLGPGESTTIRIEVDVRRRARHDHTYPIMIRARVQGSTMPLDTVQADVRVH